MIKVSSLEKYGLSINHKDVISVRGGNHCISAFSPRPIMYKPLHHDMLIEVYNDYTTVENIKIGEVIWELWTHWRPSMQWLVQQEMAGYKDETDYFGEAVPVEIPTETPEEKEAFDAIEKKSPYDVGAHVSDASKPVLPSVGHKLKFTHDIDGAFKHLHSEVYGWEHGDSLEVIHATENHHGEGAVIVLNTQSDVLTTAVIIDPSFFDDRTELKKTIDEMVATAVNSSDDIAKSIIYEACVKLAKAGYTK